MTNLIQRKTFEGEKIKDELWLKSIYDIVYKPSPIEYTPEQKYNMIGAIVRMWAENDVLSQVIQEFKEEDKT